MKIPNAYTRARAAVPDGHEQRGRARPRRPGRTVERARRRAVHYRLLGKPACVYEVAAYGRFVGQNPYDSWKTTPNLKRVTCKRCLYWEKYVAHRPEKPERSFFDWISGIRAAAEELAHDIPFRRRLRGDR